VAGLAGFPGNGMSWGGGSEQELNAEAELMRDAVAASTGAPTSATSAGWLTFDKPTKWRQVPWRERLIGMTLALVVAAGVALAVVQARGRARDNLIVLAIVVVPLSIHFGRVLAVRLGRRRVAAAQAAATAGPERRSPIS